MPSMTQFVTWPYVLHRGHSDDPSKGACAMDAVNWLVHGKHGDAPTCTCPIIGGFVIHGNDAMPDDVRQKLLAYLPRISGSRSRDHETARLRIIVLASLRIFAPAALRVAGFIQEAERLEAIPDDVDWRIAAAAARAAARAVAAAGWAAAAAEAAAARATRAAATGAEEATAAAARATRAAATAAEEAAAAAAEAAAAARAVARAMRAAAAEAAAATRAAATAAEATAAEARAWDSYFVVLDAVLNAGPQGEPWSADAIALGANKFLAAGGVAQLVKA